MKMSISRRNERVKLKYIDDHDRKCINEQTKVLQRREDRDGGGESRKIEVEVASEGRGIDDESRVRCILLLILTYWLQYLYISIGYSG